jgi:hypothetical protein
MSGTLTIKAIVRQLHNPDENFQWAEATDKEVLEIARPFITYTGPFDVIEDNGELR